MSAKRTENQQVPASGGLIEPTFQQSFEHAVGRPCTLLWTSWSRCRLALLSGPVLTTANAAETDSALSQLDEQEILTLIPTRLLPKKHHIEINNSSN